jgi:hypothetical protein
MAIQKLLNEFEFRPEEAQAIVEAYEAVMFDFAEEYDDSLASLVAEQIVQIARGGIIEPKELSNAALQSLRSRLRE